MPSPKKNEEDRRVLRTKSLVFEAFYQLVQSTRYDELKSKDIVESAGIGKSTFYEHFLDKDDVLSQSLENPLTVFAKALIGNTEEEEEVSWTLKHFWERRMFARVILQHPTREVVDSCLRKLIIKHLDKTGTTNELDSFARASFLSSGFLSLLNEWLTGRIQLNTDDMANYISKLSTLNTIS